MKTCILVVLTAALFALLPSQADATLGILEGSCGELDSELTDGSSHFFSTTVLVLQCEFTSDYLTLGGLAILQDPNASGSAVQSQVLAFELLAQCESADLIKTQSEIQYDVAGKTTDALIEIEGTRLGLMVTRAIKFPFDTPLLVGEAEALLQDKLEDVQQSSANVDAVDAWQKQILVLVTPLQGTKTSLMTAYASLPPAVTADTIVMVVVTDGDDDFVYSGNEPICVGTAAPSVRPAWLLQNHPNPFNPRTTITYSVPQSGLVELEIYDVTGRHVRTIVSGVVNAGGHRVHWNGIDDAGERVASGVYLYQLRVGGFVETKQMVLLK